MTSIKLTRSTWWQVTAFGDNMKKLDEKINVPDVVKDIYGGIEQCPTTGKLHYQGAIHCHTQCRGGVILNWLPGAHIEKADSVIATKRYAMKKDTAVGEKTEWTNPEEYLTMDKALDKLASVVPDDKDCPEEYDTLKKIVEWQFWEGVKKLVEAKPSLIGLYSQPQIYRAWQHTRSVWIERAKSIVLQPALEGSSKNAEESGEENLYD